MVSVSEMNPLRNPVCRQILESESPPNPKNAAEVRLRFDSLPISDEYLTCLHQYLTWFRLKSGSAPNPVLIQKPKSGSGSGSKKCTYFGSAPCPSLIGTTEKGLSREKGLWRRSKQVGFYSDCANGHNLKSVFHIIGGRCLIAYAIP